MAEIDRKKLYKALSLAKNELHEMRLAQNNGNPPRNPALTQEAELAVLSALEDLADIVMVENGSRSTTRGSPQDGC